MNVDQKLAAIRDLIQQDVGNRGLARDPERNLINACPDDFANACASVAHDRQSRVAIVTGFMIPTVQPPLDETDGPLGALFIAQAFQVLNIAVYLVSDASVCAALHYGFGLAKMAPVKSIELVPPSSSLWNKPTASDRCRDLLHFQANALTHLIALERVGPSHDLTSLLSQRGNDEAVVSSFKTSVPQLARNHHYTMRGRDIDELTSPAHLLFEPRAEDYRNIVTIGIGDGGNEIGMGKIPWDTIRRNIPNGELIACRVPTDHLIVAGVSNWGAYALAAGVALLRGVELPKELFDPNRERELLQMMVNVGPLVDGVTGKQEATVDGLSWDDYIKPLVEIGKIVRS